MVSQRSAAEHDVRSEDATARRPTASQVGGGGRDIAQFGPRCPVDVTSEYSTTSFVKVRSR
jgi:hypothetical protein